jgi:hypothetical protein
MGMLNGRFFEYKFKTDNDYYNEKLIEGAKNINSKKKSISPFFFDPEICDIHNEKLNIETGLDIKNLMKIEHINSVNLLKTQENKLNNKTLFKYLFFKK